MISLDDLYAVVKTASAPAPQDTPGGQAMAAAAKMAAPPGAPPMPQAIEQPLVEAAAADPTAEQQKHLADIAKKDKEIGELRTKTQELKLDIQRMQMTSELQKQQQAMLDKVRNEQKLLDKKQTEFTSAEAAHKANLEKETARHEVMRAKADAKSLADIARRDADSIKSNAEQNAKNYVKMVEDARKTTDSYMASKEKAFAQTQDAAKKNSPYVSVALRSNIDGALTAAKNIGKLRSRIAKDDIKFNKVASQGSADLAQELKDEETSANTAAWDEMMDNAVDRYSNIGESANDANNEYQRLKGWSSRTDVQNSKLMSEIASKAKSRAKQTLGNRNAKNADIIENPSNYSAEEVSKAYADRGRVTMAGKSYSDYFTGKTVMESANKQMQRAGLHNTTVGAWKQQQQAAADQADKDRPWYASVGKFLGDMVTGIYTGPRDAILNGMKASDAADAFGVNRTWSGGVEATGNNGSTQAFKDYANEEGLATNVWKDVGNIGLQSALSVASVIPMGGALAAGIGGLARAGTAMAAKQVAKNGLMRAAGAGAKELGKGAWQAGKTFIGGGNKSVLGGKVGKFGNRVLGAMDMARGGIMGAQMLNMGSQLAGKGGFLPDWATGQASAQGQMMNGASYDSLGTSGDYNAAWQQQREESNPYASIGQGIHSASAKVTDPFTKYAAILGAYDWEDNDTAERLKDQAKNVYTTSKMGQAAAFLSPFVSAATGGRVKLAPDYNLPVPTPKKFDVARAMSDFQSQHWRPTFNPEADKYPTPMMGHTLKQFHAAQRAKGKPWTYQYRHSQLGGMSSTFDDSRHNLGALLDLVHGI